MAHQKRVTGLLIVGVLFGVGGLGSMSGQATGEGEGCGGAQPSQEAETQDELRLSGGSRRQATPARQRSQRRTPTRRGPSRSSGGTAAPTGGGAASTITKKLVITDVTFHRGPDSGLAIETEGGVSIPRAPNGADDLTTVRIRLSSPDFAHHGPDKLVVGSPVKLMSGGAELGQVNVDAVLYPPPLTNGWAFQIVVGASVLGQDGWPVALDISVPFSTPIGARTYTTGAREFRRHDDLTAMLEPILAAVDHTPALAAAVVSGSGLLAIGAVGIRAKDHPEEVTINDRWHIGSDTKAMTATVLARLVAAGLLTWETKLPDAFASFAADIDPGYADITLEHLVVNQGGVPPDLPPAVAQAFGDPNETVTELRAYLAETVLKEPPAQTGYTYSNGGFIIAGAAMEAATGKSWEALMAEHVFGPLGAKTCGFGAPGSSSQIDQPRGHHLGAGGILLGSVNPSAPGADSPAALGPAGTVHCSLADWGRFLSLHLRGANGDESYLPSSYWLRMHKRFNSSVEYGHGWGISYPGWGGGRTLSHDGSNMKWYATAKVAPNRDRAFMVVTNRAIFVTGGASQPDDPVPVAFAAAIDALKAAYISP